MDVFQRLSGEAAPNIFHLIWAHANLGHRGVTRNSYVRLRMMRTFDLKSANLPHHEGFSAHFAALIIQCLRTVGLIAAHTCRHGAAAATPTARV